LGPHNLNSGAPEAAIRWGESVESMDMPEHGRHELPCLSLPPVQREPASITNLVVALFSLEGTYELVMDPLLPLMRYGNEFTAYGWSVIGAIATRVVVTGSPQRNWTAPMWATIRS